MQDKDAAVTPYKSESKTWVAGTSLDFTKFVEPRGPREGRNIIRNIVVHATLNLTVADATLNGEDLARAFRSVTITEKDGTQRMTEVTGDALRIISWAHNGGARHHEHADFGVSTASVNLTISIPLAKPFAYDAEDNMLAAELLDKVSVRCADATNMSVGGATVTVNSGSYWVIAECVEQMGIVQHVPDEWIVRSFSAAAQTEFELLFGVGRCHDLYIWVPGAEGGQTLANLTEVNIEHVMSRSLLKDPDLAQMYIRKRDAARNALSAQGAALRTDPFSGATLRACAALLTAGNKSFEGPVRDKLTVRLTESAALPAAPSIIARIVHPRNMKTQAELMAAYKKRGFYVKTKDKSRRDPGKWNPKHLPYLPIKFF